MPRAALLSLHARVDAVESSTLGGSLARPAVGPSLPDLCRREARLRAVLAREASRQRQGPPSSRAHGGAVARPSRRQADDGPRGCGRTRRRELAQVRHDDGHGRHPLGPAHVRRRSGRSSPRRSSRPTPVASSLDATSTFSGPRRPTGSPAGQESPGGRRPTHSRRSKHRCCRFERRVATSGCSRRTSRRFAPPRRPPRPRACCRAAMPTSCSTEQSASFSFRARISGSVCGRPACGRARSSSKARSAEPGDGRSTPYGSTPGHVSRVERATRSRPRPARCRFRASIDRSRWSGTHKRSSDIPACWPGRGCITSRGPRRAQNGVHR